MPRDALLAELVGVWDADPQRFLRGVHQYSAMLVSGALLDSFEDGLALMAFNSALYRKMAALVPSPKEEGSSTLTGEARAPREDAAAFALSISRLCVSYVLCHELAHLLPLSLNHKEAGILAEDETVADNLGWNCLWRLQQAGGLAQVWGKEFDDYEVIGAGAAFHSWNLSKGLSEVFARCISGNTTLERTAALDRLHEIAQRRETDGKLTQRIVNESASAPQNGIGLLSRWAIPCAGLLILNLRCRGIDCDIDQAGQYLSLLANRNSRLYELLLRDRVSSP